MATKSFKQLKNLSKDELASKGRELESGLFQAKIKLATGQLEDTASIWRMRKDIARVKTLGTSSASQAAPVKGAR